MIICSNLKLTTTECCETWTLAFSPCIQEIVVVGFIRKPVFSGSKGNSMPPPSFSCNDVLLPAFVLVQKVPPPTYTLPERLFVRCATKKKYQSKCFLYLFVGGKEQKWRHHGVHSTLLESALWKYQENSFCNGELSVALLISGDKKKTGEEVPIERCKWWNYWRKLNRNAGLET